MPVVTAWSFTLFPVLMKTTFWSRSRSRRASLRPSAAAGRKEARRERDLLQKVVFIKTGNKVKLQAVTTGIADNTWIEVKQGVRPGDEVVSGTYAAISRTLKD